MTVLWNVVGKPTAYWWIYGQAIRDPRFSVEDDFAIGLLIGDYLSDLGCVTVGPYPTLQAAKRAAESEKVDVGLIDVNLFGKMSYEVDDLLVQRNVPFALVSGCAKWRGILIVATGQFAPNLSHTTISQPHFADSRIHNKSVVETEHHGPERGGVLHDNFPKLPTKVLGFAFTGPYRAIEKGRAPE